MVRPATSHEDLEVARALFVEYVEALKYDTCFDNFDQEMSDLPKGYGPPGGALLISCSGTDVVGVVGLMAVGPKTVEMKRLYV